MQLEGKLALVTGASSGIGVEIARELGTRSAHVICVARTKRKLEETAGLVRRSGGKAEVLPADLSDLGDIRRLAGEVRDTWGAPDLIVNNAGLGRWLAIDETEPGDVVEMTTVPYMAAFELTRELVPGMIERGSGHVLNMTSLAGFITIPGANAYGVARWAMRAFSAQLREDLAGTGVGVTLLAPAEVDSPYFDNNPGSRERIPKVGFLTGQMTPEQVGREAVRAVEQERGTWIVPRQARWIYYTTPPPIMRRLVSKSGWKRGAQPTNEPPNGD